ncbi:MAG: ParB/RepB/Spo0J family partition protein [Chthoniobacteraceae bacterium]
MAKAALGKGLGALISTRPASPLVSPTPAVESGERVQLVPLSRIVASPFQPRMVFRDEHIDELVGSIREHGIIQPLIVRLRGENCELIAGERRWRAAQRAGLTEAPVIVREAGDRDVLELALIENLQREDLNPIEEAHAFARLAREFGEKQEEIAQKVGKSRAAVANSMRLLELDAEVQGWLVQDRISVGHAKVLLSLKERAQQRLLADEIIRRSLTVRAAEKLVSAHFEENGTLKPRRSTTSASDGLSPALVHLQNRLQQHLATHVELHHGPKRGRIEIEYYGNDDLQRLLQLINLPDER